MSKELLSEAVQQQSDHRPGGHHHRPARRHSQSDIIYGQQDQLVQDLAARKKEQVGAL